MRIGFALAIMGMVAAFAPPAHADITLRSQDGTLELTLPNGWREAKRSGPNVKIHAAGHGARVTVRVHPKEDFKDLRSVATFTAERLKKKFIDAEPKYEDVQVNGQPAVRVEWVGTEANGLRAGYIITILEASGSYIAVIGTGSASAFAKQQPLLAGVASQLRMIPGTETTPAAVQSQPLAGAPAPAQQPPPAGPATRPARPGR